MLRQELLLVHETYTRKSPHVVESLMYREHFLGAEFIGLIVYRYLQSSLHRQHVNAVGSLLTAPTRWFSLDPVWRYTRPGGSRAPRGGA